jgi:hypothetical protein
MHGAGGAGVQPGERPDLQREADGLPGLHPMRSEADAQLPPVNFSRDLRQHRGLGLDGEPLAIAHLEDAQLARRLPPHAVDAVQRAHPDRQRLGAAGTPDGKPGGGRHRPGQPGTARQPIHQRRAGVLRIRQVALPVSAT